MTTPAARRLSISHTTSYRFAEPVTLWPHRLMLRPREGRDLRVLSHDVTTAPHAQLSWGGDVFGNVVGMATFNQTSSQLVITSRSEIEISSGEWPVFNIAASAINCPFTYTDDELMDLGSLRAEQYVDADGRLRGWARGFILSAPTDTLSLLRDISSGVGQRISYQSRDQEGTQGPLDTLGRGYGSCRDFAVLFAEAARALGFAARIVSGYLYNPDLRLTGSADAGSTHAWTEIYVPGAGWISFDPTNRSVGGFNLIPVAVGRHIAQLMPVSGSFVGMTNAYAGMSVEVAVEPV